MALSTRNEQPVLLNFFTRIGCQRRNIPLNQPTAPSHKYTATDRQPSLFYHSANHQKKSRNSDNKKTLP
jgi:hypothetical protein